MQGERDYLRYQEHLAHRRDELAMDLGTAAITMVTGGAISERPAIETYERRSEIQEKVAPKMAHLAVADTVELRRPVAEAPVSTRLYEGYAVAA